MAWGLLAARSPMAADVAADRGGHGGCPRRGAILLLDRTPTLQKLMSSKVQAQSSATRNYISNATHQRQPAGSSSSTQMHTLHTGGADGQPSKEHIVHVDTYYQI
ncbi:unnamed protein product [Urochloa humidicola]